MHLRGFWLKKHIKISLTQESVLLCQNTLCMFYNKLYENNICPKYFFKRTYYTIPPLK